VTGPGAEERAAVATVCRHLAASGLSPGSSGNVSLRRGDELLVTPTRTALARVGPDDLALLGLDGERRDGPAPSKEVPLHLAVHRTRPDALAVVHLHSPYAVAAACLPVTADGTAPLAPLTPYQVLRVGDVPVAPYAPPGSAELAAGVARLAPTAAALLLANHGSVTAGADLDAAADLAEELEAAARLHFLLRGGPYRTLTAEAVAALRR